MPWCKQSAAIRASCTCGPVTWPFCTSVLSSSQFTVYTPYKREAARFAREKQRELERRHARGAAGRTTVAELLADFRENELEEDRRAGTVATYEASLALIEEFFVDRQGDPVITDVGSAAVKRFTQWRKRSRRDGRGTEVSNRTVNKDLATLSVLFEYAVDLELLDANPVRQKHHLSVESREPTIITPGQYEDLLGACADDPMLWAFVLTLGETAMRSTSEANWLRFRDVDLDEGFITVGASRPTKTGKTRRALVSAALDAGLREHRRRFQLNPYPGDWLFYHTTTARHHRAGERVASFYDAFKARATRAEIALDDNGRSRLNQHDLRHSRITWLLAEGAPIQHVQALAGHASVTMTEHYYAYVDEHQEKLREFFPQVANI